MLAAAHGVCRNFSGCIYGNVLGQTIRRAFGFRHTAMQPVCMDCDHCSFGFHEKMGEYFQHIYKMDGSEILGTLFISLPLYRDDSRLPDHVYKISGSLLYLFVAAAGFAGAYLAYEIIRRIPVLRWTVCGI